MKIMADCKRTDQQFTVGNQVLLKLQPHTEFSVASCPFPKLAFKYFGPYTVLERISGVAYGSQIHLAIETGPIQILERRLVQKGGGAIPQVHVQWSDLPASATTWEDYYVLKERFRTALLGDKQDALDGGAVTMPTKAQTTEGTRK